MTTEKVSSAPCAVLASKHNTAFLSCEWPSAVAFGTGMPPAGLACAPCSPAVAPAPGCQAGLPLVRAPSQCSDSAPSLRSRVKGRD